MNEISKFISAQEIDEVLIPNLLSFYSCSVPQAQNFQLQQQ